ncbi:MAG: FAD-dependent oxidoreductase [Alphaproteobacteria bacterium]|nr:FAD-dependent oxidoreductase [Alphaproteobacteria bacterium]
MAELIKADLCIIGAGSGGLSVAAGAAQLGQKVVLIERHKMGGDCLNYGCVPSKSLIAAASHAHAVRRAREFGVDAGEPKTDFARVMKHVHDVIAAIEPNDSVERFEKLGVRVVKASARFVGPHEVEAGDLRISARYFIVATGSSPLKPPIPGLEQTPYFTNETLFDNTVLPEHLIIIGGGPIGIELAQAHRRLGSRVSVLEAKQILPKDDSDAVAIVRDALTKDGVVVREGASVTAVAKTEGGVSVTIARNGQSEVVTGSHLLLAAGRTSNVDGLNLEAAGVKYSRKGIEVDAGLRTANSRVYAIGDVAGGLQFTHVAGYHAGIIIRRLLFKVPAKADAATPWCTYTDPELAHVGLTEASAREKGLKVSIARWPLHDNDRAQAERELQGLAKVVVVNGRVVGATIVAPHAGDLILPWVMAVGQKMKLSAMAGLVAPYPTLGEISKRAAGSYFTPTLFSGRTRGLIKILSWFGPRR